MNDKPNSEELLYEDLTYRIIGAAMEVHRILGAGFLEAVYEEALGHELTDNDISFERQVQLDINYKGKILDKKYRADFIIESKVIVDNKASSDVTAENEAQMFNYLKVTGKRLGLIINYAKSSLEWKRIIC